MRLEITGIVEHVNGIKPNKKGFSQTVVLWQPGVKDEFDRVTQHDQYFVISIWSNNQTDSRFLGAKDMKSKKKAAVYLKGERWINQNNTGFSYNHKLNLDKWQS
jgi:hypothetical protein